MANDFRRSFAHLGTAYEVVYECPEGTTAVIIGAQVANVHEDETPLDANVDLSVFDGESDYFLVKNLTVPVGSAIDLVTGKVALGEGDMLRARGDIETALDLVLAILEVS